MIVKVNSQQIETYEKGLDLKFLKKKGNAKTPSGLILGFKERFKNSTHDNFSKLDLLKVLEKLWRDTKDLETSEKIKLESWKGKSSIKFINKPDRIIVITFQKPDQDSEPKQIKREITKQELNRVIWAINKLNKGKKISSRKIGELVYNRHWDDVFSDRFAHTQLNYCLRILDHYEITKYRGKYTTVKKYVREIQEVLL